MTHEHGHPPSMEYFLPDEPENGMEVWRLLSYTEEECRWELHLATVSDEPWKVEGRSPFLEVACGNGHITIEGAIQFYKEYKEHAKEDGVDRMRMIVPDTDLEVYFFFPIYAPK